MWTNVTISERLPPAEPTVIIPKVGDAVMIRFVADPKTVRMRVRCGQIDQCERKQGAGQGQILFHHLTVPYTATPETIGDVKVPAMVRNFCTGSEGEFDT